MKVLVLGGAMSVMDDARSAFGLFEPDQIYAANHVGIIWPGRLDVWVSMHPLEFKAWQQEREKAGRNTDYDAVTYLHAKGKGDARINHYHPHVWPEQRNSGSSGLLAVKFALDRGATHVVLAGMPIDVEGSHIVRGGGWHSAKSYQQTWLGIMPRIQGRVKSMSGWTASILGQPTKEWLAAEAVA